MASTPAVIRTMPPTKVRRKASLRARMRSAVDMVVLVMAWSPEGALARKGLRAFVISGNLGLPDAKSRYGLPGDEIERHIRDFIDQVSAAG